MLASELESLIRTAFRGVRLDGGISLHQAKVLDDYGRGVTEAEFRRLPLAEMTDDWTALSLGELDQYPHLAHLDAAGFRYYIPAFMLSVLSAYDDLSMRVIATIGALYPRSTGGAWEHRMQQYSRLDERQKAAVARYLEALPLLVPLDGELEKCVARGLRNFWQTYLSQAPQ